MKSRINEIIDKKMKYEVHDKVLAIANRKRNSCVQILRLSFSIIVLTIMLFMFMNNNYAKYDFKDNIIINERKSMGGSRIDAIAIPIYNNNDYKNNEGISEYKFYKDIELLSKYDDISMYAIYGRKNKSDKEYNVFNCYNIVYINREDNKEININFSRKNKPFRDYHFDDVAFYSIINDTKIKIFKYEDIYFTEFIYNGVNFDIELQNVDKEELVVLLKSIIK